MQKRLQRLKEKWSLALAIQPIILLVIIVKFIFISQGLEVWTMNPLLSGLIAANVFLLGFLISGVLMDYKEAERLPGDIAASLAALFDEIKAVYKEHRAPAALDCLDQVHTLTLTLKNWFHKKQNTDALMAELSALSDHLAALESSGAGESAVHIKAEQSAIRRTLIRVRTIRGTFFVPSGYAIAEATNISVIVALWLTSVAETFESLFFVGLIAFLTTYMLALIRRLDNPFDYYSKESDVDEISLMPLDEVQRWIEEFKAQIKK
jgi:predicted membrane chloride channel (bestrophin family)